MIVIFNDFKIFQQQTIPDIILVTVFFFWQFQSYKKIKQKLDHRKNKHRVVLSSYIYFNVIFLFLSKNDLTVSLYGIISNIMSFHSSFIFSRAFSKECSLAAAAPISSNLQMKLIKVSGGRGYCNFKNKIWFPFDFL